MRFLVQVEVVSRGLTTDVEHGIREILTDHSYCPTNIKVEYAPARFTLTDANPALVRRSEGDETYRVVIPGLRKDGKEVHVPIWDEDADPELLLHILDNEGTWG